MTAKPDLSAEEQTREGGNPLGLPLPSTKESEWLKIASQFAALMCLIALFPLPMRSFYTVFRVAVFGVALWQFWAGFRRGSGFLTIVFAAVAACFNPLWRVEVSGLPWKPAAFVAAILFLVASSRQDISPSTPEDIPPTEL